MFFSSIVLFFFITIAFTTRFILHESDLFDHYHPSYCLSFHRLKLQRERNLKKALLFDAQRGLRSCPAASSFMHGAYVDAADRMIRRMQRDAPKPHKTKGLRHCLCHI